MCEPQCPDQSKLDVNDRYQRGVVLIINLATASLVLPILFLKNIIKVPNGSTISHILTNYVYAGWILLALSIGMGFLFIFFSAKWVKLAWNQPVDIFWIDVWRNDVSKRENFLEFCLDTTFFLMMSFFGFGLYYILDFIINHMPK